MMSGEADLGQALILHIRAGVMALRLRLLQVMGDSAPHTGRSDFGYGLQHWSCHGFWQICLPFPAHTNRHT